MTGAARADPSREDSIKEATFISRLQTHNTPDAQWVLAASPRSLCMMLLESEAFVEKDSIKY
jgi:hypothetical protein